MNGLTALALVVIGSFAGFVLWGKTGTGKRVLRETLGEPAVLPKKPATRRPSNATTKRKPSGTKPTAKKKATGTSAPRRKSGD